MTAHAQAGCQQIFIGTQRLYAHNRAAASEVAWPLERGAPLGTVTYQARGAAAANSLDDYLGMFCTTGFLVLPDFADSAFGPATVEDLLRMSSGVELKNSYRRGDTSDNLATNPIVNPRQNIREFLRSKQSVAAPGSSFAYNGAVTALLGLMLSARTDMSNTDFLARRLWGPMGAQMTALRPDKPQPARAPYYGLHIWIPQAAGGRSFFWGTNGQNIFVDPVAKVVIVHTGNSPDAEFNGNAHLFPLRDAIVRKLAGH